MATVLEEDIEKALAGTIIKVYVGPKRKCYEIHASLLNQCACFKASPIRLDRMFLEHANAADFELLVSWLYRKTLPQFSKDSKETAKKQAWDYYSLYTAAVGWELPGLQNTIIDQFRTAPKDSTYPLTWFSPPQINTIFNQTSKDSPQRRYIIDTFLFNSCRYHSDDIATYSTVEVQLENGNHDFVMDYCKALLGVVASTKVKDPKRKARCEYHVHEDGKMCT